MDRFKVSAELLSDIKNYLDITWDDTATDDKLKTLIAGGSTYLRGKCVADLNFEIDDLPRTLLFDYVRYARDSALDIFENNYISLILAMQNNEAVKAHHVESSKQTKK